MKKLCLLLFISVITIIGCDSLTGQNVCKNTSILRFVSDSGIMIEALDGQAYISDAKHTFKSYIDEDFKNLGLNQSGPATTKTLLDIREMTADGTFIQIFAGITPDLDKIVMTQAQIISFCEKYSTWICQGGCDAIFLTEVNDEYFVVDVGVDDVGSYAFVHRLGNSHVWYGEKYWRIVVPHISLAE